LIFQLCGLPRCERSGAASGRAPKWSAKEKINILASQRFFW